MIAECFPPNSCFQGKLPSICLFDDIIPFLTFSQDCSFSALELIITNRIVALMISDNFIKVSSVRTQLNSLRLGWYSDYFYRHTKCNELACLRRWFSMMYPTMPLRSQLYIALLDDSSQIFLVRSFPSWDHLIYFNCHELDIKRQGWPS